MTPLQEMIAAKLAVLIEGIADHKMMAHNIEALSKEIVSDITALITEVSA